jgi:hypothetical protein
MLKMNRLGGLTPNHLTHNASRTFTIMLDTADCIGYASSSIEDALSIDYNTICGKHVSMLLPDLLSRCNDLASSETRIEQLEKMGKIKTLACHADGHTVPVVVTLVGKRYDAVLKPILLITINPSSSRRL